MIKRLERSGKERLSPYFLLFVCCFFLACKGKNPDPPLTIDYIKSVEVKNKQTGEIKVDNFARFIDIEIDKDESKDNVIVSLELAEGVSMVSPATTEAEYNLEEPVTVSCWSTETKPSNRATARKGLSFQPLRLNFDAEDESNHPPRLKFQISINRIDRQVGGTGQDGMNPVLVQFA